MNNSQVFDNNEGNFVLRMICGVLAAILTIGAGIAITTAFEPLIDPGLQFTRATIGFSTLLVALIFGVIALLGDPKK